MNQLIRELAEQAMIETPYEFGGTYMAFSKEKFAQLVARRCIQVALDLDDPIMAVEMADLFGIDK